MLTSLVTGGAGFVGSHVAEHLLQLGHKVVVLDDLSGGFVDNIPWDADFVQGSVLDHKLMDGMFEKYHFDYVFHLAAYAAEGLSHFIKRFNYNNNLIGSVNLINAAVNYEVRCLVFTSSIAVYGGAQAPMREDMIPVPEDSYGIAKLAVERELEISHAMFGLKYVIFRPHNVYGERQNIGDRYRNVVGIFMNQLLKGEAMTIFGDGEQQRAFTYISDVAPVIAEAAENSAAHQRIFNLGADQPCSVNQLAWAVSEAMELPCRVKYLDPRNEVKLAFSDHRAAEKVFGKRENVGLREGIRKMAAWVREHGARESSIFQDIEIARHLPPSWASVVEIPHPTKEVVLA